MPALPDDWRERMTAMVSGRQPLDPELFAGGPVLTPIEQIGVYRDQYRLRIYDALLEEVQGLKHLLADDVERVLWAYLDAHPSRSWTLNRIASQLVWWLESSGAPIEQVEMARVDEAVQRGFEAADGVPITPESLVAMPRLRLQPPVRLLRLTTNVHDIRGAAVQELEPPTLETGLDVHLVLFRRDNRMRHWALNAAPFRVLERIGEGAELMEAITSTVEDGLIDPSGLAASVQEWFKDFAELQLVEVAS